MLKQLAIKSGVAGGVISGLMIMGTGVASAAAKLAVTGTPAASGSSSLIQVGEAISGGNSSINGGTYYGLNAPASGPGSTADFVNFQSNGSSKVLITNTGSLTVAGSITGRNLLLPGTGTLTTGTGAVTLGSLGAGIVLSNASGTLSSGMTLPAAVQGNITATGALTSGSITSGFGAISTSHNITTSATVQGGVVNASVIQIGGVNINIAGTLSNVAYLNASNIFSSSATFTGLLTSAGGINNIGGTINSAGAITDKPLGGALGTAANTVDARTYITVNQTTAGASITLPSPTQTTAGRIVYVSNIGTATFTLNALSLEPGSTGAFIWNGSAWSHLK